MNRVRTCAFLSVALGLALAGDVSRAGIIIDGTDANDHGGVSGGVNQNGWEYMQRALSALAPTTNSLAARVVVDIGTTAGSQARNAINSAFNLSTLPGQGWTLVHIDGAANVDAYLANLSTANSGLLYLPTYNLTGGDLAFDEMQAINSRASQINSFVGSGGSLFSMGESNSGTNTGAYGWLQQLLPGLTFTDVGVGGIGTNITLTPEGAAAFPGLTNSDLAGADPWHVHFSGNLGGMFVLGTAPDGNNTRNVILGNVTGPIVPEPSSIVLMAAGTLVVCGLRKRFAARAEA